MSLREHLHHPEANPPISTITGVPRMHGTDVATKANAATTHAVIPLSPFALLFLPTLPVEG